MAAKHASAQDLLQRMRAVALRDGAASPARSGKESSGPPPVHEAKQPLKPGPSFEETPRREQRVRYTVDLDRSQHRFLRQFALEAEVDASVVIRVLLRLLAEDMGLARQVRALISLDNNRQA